MAGEEAVGTDNLLVRVQAMLMPQPKPTPMRPLTLPHTFKPLFDTRRSQFIRYMHKRGFHDFAKLKPYGLQVCTTGPFCYRIIFPVYFNARLVTWTGRAISPCDQRYKSLSYDPDKAEGDTIAEGPISDYLLWFDDLLKVREDTIVLTEGPFDALKVDYLGRQHGIRASCFFTAAPSEHQISLLHELLPRFTNKLLLLDRNTTATAMRVAARLSALGVRYLQLPEGVKDPGEIMSAVLLQNLLDHR
jgi:hypothetical protein